MRVVIIFMIIIPLLVISCEAKKVDHDKKGSEKGKNKHDKRHTFDEEYDNQLSLYGSGHSNNAPIININPIAQHQLTAPAIDLIPLNNNPIPPFVDTRLSQGGLPLNLPVSVVQERPPHTIIKTIIKEVKVPYPVNVPVEKHIKVPYPVPVPAPYPVEKPIPYPVIKKVPVEITKTVPVYIEKKVPYPVQVPVKVPVQIPAPVPVPVPCPIVERPFPFASLAYPAKKAPFPQGVYFEKPVHLPYTIHQKIPALHPVFNDKPLAIQEPLFLDHYNGFPLIPDFLDQRELPLFNGIVNKEHIDHHFI